MNRTVAEHIDSLQEKRRLLCGRIMEEQDKERRNQLEAELRAIESALTLYRSALEIEARILTRP